MDAYAWRFGINSVDSFDEFLFLIETLDDEFVKQSNKS